MFCGIDSLAPMLQMSDQTHLLNDFYETETFVAFRSSESPPAAPVCLPLQVGLWHLFCVLEFPRPVILSRIARSHSEMPPLPLSDQGGGAVQLRDPRVATRWFSCPSPGLAKRTETAPGLPIAPPAHLHLSPWPLALCKPPCSWAVVPPRVRQRVSCERRLTRPRPGGPRV